jgi:diaminopimelate decarboxylase
MNVDINPSSKIARSLAEGSRRNVSPAFYFYRQTLLDRLAEVASVSDPETIYYSLKANPELLVIREVAAAGFAADVASIRELKLALEAGFPPHRISCVGPWKPADFLEAAIEAGVGRICVESVAEFEWLAAKRHAPQLYARLLLSREALPIAEQMATAVSPFGLTLEEVAMLDPASSRFSGVHIYVGSDFQSVEAAAEVLTSNAFTTSSVQFGPGLGISYELGKSDPAWSALVKQITKVRPEKTSFEMGRYLVAHCAILLATVQIVKVRAGKKVCVLDAGMTSFARTILTGARHPVVCIGREISGVENADVILCGPTCTPLDRINGACLFDSVDVGDQVAVLCAGAYGVNLNFSGFLGFDRAPFLSDGG